VVSHQCHLESSILACGSQKVRYAGTEVAAMIAEETADMPSNMDLRECLVCGAHFQHPCALVAALADARAYAEVARRVG